MGLVEGGELVLHGHHTAGQVEIKHAHPEAHAVGVGLGRVIVAVAGGKEHPPVGLVDRVRDLGRESRGAHPDPGAAAVRSGAEDADRLQGRGVVGKNPPVPRSLVVDRAEGDVQDAVQKQQPGALNLESRVEGQSPAGTAGAGARHRALNQHRPVELFRAGRDVEGVQIGGQDALDVLGADYVKGVRREVDDRGPEDGVVVGNASRHVRQQRRLPERCGVHAAVDVRVEGIENSPGGPHVNNVVHAFAGNGDLRGIERLGADRAAYRLREQLAESPAADGGRRQDRLVQILAGPGDIVVRGENVDLRLRRSPDQQAAQSEEGKNVGQTPMKPALTALVDPGSSDTDTVKDSHRFVAPHKKTPESKAQGNVKVLTLDRRPAFPPSFSQLSLPRLLDQSGIAGLERANLSAHTVFRLQELL